MPTHTHAVSGERAPALDVFDAVMLRCLAGRLIQADSVHGLH